MIGIGAALLVLSKRIRDRPPSVAHGLAQAWAAHREKQRPRSMLALQDGENGESHWTVFWSLEDALKDRLDEGIVEAVVRPLAFAFPDAEACGYVAGQFRGDIGDCVSEWSDFTLDSDDSDEPVVLIHGSKEERQAIWLDLSQRLAATFRSWAVAHGALDSVADRGVEIAAYRFTGPEQRYTYDGKRWNPA